MRDGRAGGGGQEAATPASGWQGLAMPWGRGGGATVYQERKRKAAAGPGRVVRRGGVAQRATRRSAGGRDPRAGRHSRLGRPAAATFSSGGATGASPTCTRLADVAAESRAPRRSLCVRPRPQAPPARRGALPTPPNVRRGALFTPPTPKYTLPSPIHSSFSFSPRVVLAPLPTMARPPPTAGHYQPPRHPECVTITGRGRAAHVPRRPPRGRIHSGHGRRCADHPGGHGGKGAIQPDRRAAARDATTRRGGERRHRRRHRHRQARVGQPSARAGRRRRAVADAYEPSCDPAAARAGGGTARRRDGEGRRPVAGSSSRRTVRAGLAVQGVPLQVGGGGLLVTAPADKQVG